MTSVKNKKSVEKLCKILSPVQREILVGTLLGDAHLRANKKKSKYQYVVLQSGAHKEYVFHLYEIFKNYTSTPPKEYTFKDKRFPGKLYTRWSFYTTYQECFRFYAHQFYTDVIKEDSFSSPQNDKYVEKFFFEKKLKGSLLKKGILKKRVKNIIDKDKQEGQIDHIVYKKRKIVPKLIHKWLTPRAIAYWYMDDGAQKWKGRSLGVRFCTDNFSLSEIQTLAQVLILKYLLKISFQKKGTNSRIYVSSDSYKDMKNLIGDFLIKSMLYKFPVENH